MKTMIALYLLAVCVLISQDRSLNTDDGHKALLVSVDRLLDEAQTGTYTIIGTVIDQSSREPIGGATVSLLGTTFSVKSSTDGQYKLELVPEGIFQLKADAEGYDPQIINNVFVGKDRPRQQIYFTLQQSSQAPPPDFVPVEKQPQPIPGSAIAPVYPELARLSGVEGTVWVKIWVDEKGNSRKAVIMRSDAEIFNQVSIDAAMKWKFSPAILKGKPVAVWVSIPFKFRLNKDVVEPEELDAQPKPLRSVYPKYPGTAKEYHLEGTFFIEAIVNEKGAVSNAYVKRLHVSDNRLVNDSLLEEIKNNASPKIYTAVMDLLDNAVNAVRKWKFSPGMKKEKAVTTKVIIPIKYSLADSKKGNKK